MSRIRSLFAGLMVAGFSVGALACIDMEDEVVVDDEVYLEANDEAYVPDEPLRAVLPPDPDTGDTTQPDATFLETEGEYVAPSQPLRIDWPDDDDGDGAADEGSIFESSQRRQ